MGLDWYTTKVSDYDGPTYHRAKGLSWVLENCGFTESAGNCYGIMNKGDELALLSNEQIQSIFQDCHTMLIKKNFPSEILDNIEEEELLEHLNEAKEMLEKVLNYSGSEVLQILCDY
jgi:hypothetical protein